MKKIIAYECSKCKKLYRFKEQALNCEKGHFPEEADKMFRDGKATLKEINERFHIWSHLPENLHDVTRDTKFKIPLIGTLDYVSEIRWLVEGIEPQVHMSGQSSIYGETRYYTKNFTIEELSKFPMCSEEEIREILKRR